MSPAWAAAGSASAHASTAATTAVRLGQLMGLELQLLEAECPRCALGLHGDEAQGHVIAYLVDLARHALQHVGRNGLRPVLLEHVGETIATEHLPVQAGLHHA